MGGAAVGAGRSCGAVGCSVWGCVVRSSWPFLLIIGAAMSNPIAAQDLGGGGAGGGGAAAGAEAVVRAAFEGIEAMRWEAVAALVHPEALARFRAWQVERARSEEGGRAEGPQGRDRGMPPEVVAWFEAQQKKQDEYWEKYGPRLSHSFAGVETIEQLETLSAAELFARHLQASDPREQFLRGARLEGKEPAIAGMEKELMVDQRVVTGSVVEDDSTVQVVYRTRSRLKLEGDARRAAVVTVRRTPEGWRILPGSSDHDLFERTPYGIFGILTEEEHEEELRQLAEKVITWPVEGGGEGRVSIAGFSGGKEPPRGLMVEISRPDGTVARVEIPFASFGALAELLHGWPPQQEPHRE